MAPSVLKFGYCPNKLRDAMPVPFICQPSSKKSFVLIFAAAASIAIVSLCFIPAVVNPLQPTAYASFFSGYIAEQALQEPVAIVGAEILLPLWLQKEYQSGY
jgi:hypothetical protein